MTIKHRLAQLLPDKIYLQIYYRRIFGRKLNLKEPKTFNEKIQWLKLYDRNPTYSKMVDKYEAKNYVENKIGKEYIIPTLGVWEEFDKINFSELPNQFVLKTTHDSGGVVIVKDKDKMNLVKTKKIIEDSLNNNYYLQGREWPYKNVKHRIIAEKYMVDESGYELKDYKFFCFNGNAEVMFMATDRSGEEETKFDFFDMDFNHLDLRNGHPNSTRKLEKPERFEEMAALAEKISEGLPHARVDLYNINGKLYFGEVTFFHWSGLKPFEPEKWDKIFGDWFMLPEKNR